ncbi:MAG: DUF2062 domain-containing protein [Bacteroidota bacterium]
MGFSFRNWINNRLIFPLFSLLRKGSSPRRLAIAISLGIVLGLFPIPGSTTGLCLLVAFLGNYNVAVMQLLNYAVYPLQLLLIIPLMALGSSIFDLEMELFSVTAMVDLFRDDFWLALEKLWKFQFAGIIAWIIFIFPLYFPLYHAAKVVVRKVST